MNWNVGTKLGVGFGLALVIFIIVGAACYFSTLQLVDASNLQKHTYEVLNHLDGTLSALKDVETGQRGYLLTGDEGYLEPYQTGIGAVDQNVQEVRRLTVDNPRQQHRLDSLEPLVKQRLAITKKVIDLRRGQTLEAAIQMVKEGEGKTGDG